MNQTKLPADNGGLKMIFPYPDQALQRDMPRQIQEGTNCDECGWPIKRLQSAIFHRVNGERVYTHSRCPSLAERRELRRQALEQS